MKKTIYSLPIIIVLILAAALALASDIGVEVDPPGYIECMLPEEPEIALGKKHDEYLVQWEPLEDIFMYQVNVIKYAKILDRNTMALAPAIGYVSGEKIADGAGNKYDIPLSITGSLEIEGASSQVDIAPLLNELRLDHDLIETAKCFLAITAIPENGKPIVQIFEIPMA